MLALAGAGTKWAWRRERDVPAKEYGTETARIIIALNPDPGAGGRAARGAAARKDLDNDHMAAAARAWRAMIGRGVWSAVSCAASSVEHAGWRFVPYTVRQNCNRRLLPVSFFVHLCGDGALSGSRLNDVLAFGVQRP
jgi:hypothetical protein